MIKNEKSIDANKSQSKEEEKGIDIEQLLKSKPEHWVRDKYAFSESGMYSIVI
jgi:hypothetical protein